MSDRITNLGSSGDAAYGRGQQRQPSSDVQGPPKAEVESEVLPDPADARLWIEDDPEGGPLIYMTIDGRTGAVLRRLPSEQVLRMAEATTYVAGQIISARA